jgi:nucleoside-diphosphate-sugar epimerase
MTGATGFVGGYLAERLQQISPDVPMFLLVRDLKGRNAEERITTHIPAFCGRIVKGDICDGEQLGLVASDRETLSHYNLDVWHIAANTRFKEHDRKEIFLVNETGTSNVLAFAKAVGAQRIHYVSTAYVAGDRRGLQYGRTVTAYEDETCVPMRSQSAGPST